MARERAFACRRRRRRTHCPLLFDAHQRSCIPHCRRHLSARYAIYMVTKPGFGLIRRAASPIIRSMVGFAGGLVGGLTAMPGSLPIIWCDLRGVSKEHQRGEVQPFILTTQVFAI